MRTRARRDSNESALVELFKAHGCEVERLSQEGVPDLLVGWGWRASDNRKLALVEVKRHGMGLRAKQAFMQSRFPVWIVRTDADVLKVCEWLKS